VSKTERETSGTIPSESPSTRSGRRFDSDYGLPTQKTVRRGLARIAPRRRHSLGIIVLDKDLNERVVNFIPPDAPVPCEKLGRFAYAYDNMTAARVEVTDGIGTSRDEVKVVGEVVLENLPQRPRGRAIDVIYRVHANETLDVQVIDVETRATRNARFRLG
jgi:hypothetical protein